MGGCALSKNTPKLTPEEDRIIADVTKEWAEKMVREGKLKTKDSGPVTFDTPLVPPGWKGFTVHYRFNNTVYHIKLDAHDEEETHILLDGKEQEDKLVHLADDRREHNVLIKLNPNTVKHEDEYSEEMAER